MPQLSERSRAVRLLALAACLLPAVAFGGDGNTKEAADSPFARTTIDVGVVVGDIDASLKFYTQALGFREASTFDVPAKMGQTSGLSNGLPFHVHVCVLGKGETATKLKLMQFPTAPGKRQDQSFIHSTRGYSYLTIFVKNLDATLARAKKHGVKPIAQGPIELPESIAKGIFLALVRDPDGNLIELVGPKGK